MKREAEHFINQSRQSGGFDGSANINAGRDVSSIEQYVYNFNHFGGAVLPFVQSGQIQEQADQNIMRAAILSDLDLIKFEITNGANVSAQDSKGWTILMRALRSMRQVEKPDITKTLIDAGADVNETNSNGESALMIAAGRGLLKSTKAIIQAGARLDEQNKWGITSLMYAAFGGCYKTARMLLQAGADTRKVAPYNDGTAIISAVQGGDAKTFAAIARSRYVDINASLRDGITLLMLALWNGRIDIVRYLLEQEINIDASDEDGITALMYASRYGDMEIMQSVVEGGADLDVKDKRGETALMHALHKDNIEIAQYLIDRGADINVKNETDFSITAGMIAHRRGTLSRIPYLNTEDHNIVVKEQKKIDAIIRRGFRSQRPIPKKWIPDLMLVDKVSRCVHTSYDPNKIEYEIEFDHPVTGCEGGSLIDLFDLPTVFAYFYPHVSDRRLRVDPDKNTLKVTGVSRHGFSFVTSDQNGNPLRSFVLEYRVTGYPVVDVTVPKEGQEVEKGKHDVAIFNGKPWHETITWDMLNCMEPLAREGRGSCCSKSTNMHFKIDGDPYMITDSLWNHMKSIHPDAP